MAGCTKFCSSPSASLECIPAQTAAAIKLSVGQVLRLVNTHGGQCVDFWAFKPDGSAYLSMEHNASVHSRTRFRAGDQLVSSRREPMIRIVGNSGLGFHDAVLCACSAELYQQLGCASYHDNCEDNLHGSLAAAGVPWIRASTPAPWNLWMHVDFADTKVLRNPPCAAVGDAIELMALMDLVVVASSCPQDMGSATNLGALVIPQDVHFNVTVSSAMETQHGNADEAGI
jgi:uncharacterized protein